MSYRPDVSICETNSKVKKNKLCVDMCIVGGDEEKAGGQGYCVYRVLMVHPKGSFKKYV